MHVRLSLKQEKSEPNLELMHVVLCHSIPENNNDFFLCFEANWSLSITVFFFIFEP